MTLTDSTLSGRFHVYSRSHAISQDSVAEPHSTRVPEGIPNIASVCINVASSDYTSFWGSPTVTVEGDPKKPSKPSETGLVPTLAISGFSPKTRV